MMLRQMLKDADLSNYPNHITIYGNNFNRQSLPKEYIEYRRKWVEYAKNHYVGEFPLHLDIEVTNSCNLRCTMCFVDFTVDKKKFIDIELFKKVVDEGTQYCLPSIKFNYRGEPMLHKQLIEMVGYAKSRGIIETQFNTNATLLNDEKAEQLIRAGLDKIIVSMDSVNPKIYNKIRVGADYNDVVSNIKRFVEIRKSFKKDKPLLRIQMVCMKENKNEIYDFIIFWRKIADQIGLIRYRRPNRGQTDHGIVDYNKYAKPCHQLYQRLIIGCDGKVTMCCGDSLRKIVIGDAYKTPIAEIWNSDMLNKIRKLHREHRFSEVTPCKFCLINRHNKGAEWKWFTDRLS